MPGKYVNFVRDASANPTLDEIVLCTLGIIADTDVIIRKSENQETSIQVTQGKQSQIQIQNVQLGATILETKIRQQQGQELPYISVDDTTSPPTIRASPPYSETVGDYNLVIESVVESVVVYTDTITLTIL